MLDKNEDGESRSQGGVICIPPRRRGVGTKSPWLAPKASMADRLARKESGRGKGLCNRRLTHPIRLTTWHCSEHATRGHRA